MNLVFIVVLLFSSCFEFSFCSDVCPKQCDCDTDKGLNRAVCVDQNIVTVDIGVPKQVQVYSLSHNGITELDNFCFKESGYTSIIILNLSYNLIFWVGIHAFSGLTSLTHLNLSNNRLRFLPSDLFWDTPRLESLDLSGNVFESLKNEPFLYHMHLQVLNLNNCRIKSLPPRLFNNLPNLRKLDLSENYMITLNTDVLKPMAKLNRLELESEYWQCNKDFIAVEDWISNHGITYDKICKKRQGKMSEKMIVMPPMPRKEVDIDTVWNVTEMDDVTTAKLPTKKLTPLQKFDQDFPALQALIIGLELGLAIGIVGTYIWLRSLCKCRRLVCWSTPSRRERRRAARLADSDMSTSLLWTTVLNTDTPPTLRRELSLPDRAPPFPAYGLPGLARHLGPVMAYHEDDRAETPPPAYTDCRINV
ncbi:hypothetical protein JYU34_003289 [Plutella xylostella]|uniref:Uncharacterized protein n=1 Tax=Plutella xylostella TaxID=51655 RepID=A0ABQ7QZM7_PLUXY|nr:hypothetical protein JYU34_003289 [Plutella xylostella]